MYNSLPWEEDITRVYVLRPVGTIVSLRGLYCFTLKKKGDIWCIVEALASGFVCIFLCVWVYVCIVVSEKKR